MLDSPLSCESSCELAVPICHCAWPCFLMQRDLQAFYPSAPCPSPESTFSFRGLWCSELAFRSVLLEWLMLLGVTVLESADCIDGKYLYRH